MTDPVGPTPPLPGTARWFGRVLLAFIRKEIAEASRYRLAFLTRGFAFVLAALSLYFFSRFVDAAENRHLRPYGGDYLAFGIVGIVAAELQHVGATTLATRVRMAQLMGYLEAQLSTPAPAWIVLGAAPVHVLLGALSRAILYIVGAWLLLGVRFHPNAATLALGAPLALVTFGGLGLLSGAATMLVRRSNPVNMVINAASALLSGVLFPVSVLPGWLQRTSQFLPLTHALELLRKGLLANAPPAAVAGPLLALVLFAIGLGAGGVALFAIALRRARVDGSLTHF